MMKLLVILVVAIWVHRAHSRRLDDDFDNNILGNPVGLGMTSGVQRDWVRISQSPPQSVSQSVGSRVELECEAMGSPAPVMQWLKGNTPLTENESFETNAINDVPSHGIAKAKSRLVINSVLPIHEGTFTCLAESGSEIASTKTKLYVSVHHGISARNITKLLAGGLLGSRSPARIVLFNTIYLDNIGNHIELPCKAVGNPIPDIIWLDPSERIINPASDGRISVLGNGELSIRGMKWDDMGVYTCVARNSVEHDSISTFVYPMMAEK
ncbi:neural/ectodermal development factor IMP-L2-like [Photinus pyralis]|uniref:neural/ectodermal development factor IMP-L2-like n=1 Tax=Photinus pyralis TaxID=7054 RepID=UPI001266FA1F|nr:neural/ectodermal development factor IMP-L2-like [Photinus pyralis]XP_031341742.1 neural/ectodermal development factor IMP-L2-like [Photinus pyralis]